MREVLTRAALGVVWLLHLLPLQLLAPIGRGLGFLFYLLGRERRGVALTNLRLCFPRWSEAERRRVGRAHFQAFGRGVLEHGILWWASKERIQRLVRVEGIEHLEAARARPVIVLAPHFIGLDMGGVRMATETAGCSMYRQQSNRVMDDMLLRGRARFVPQRLFSRRDGIRPLIRAMREGLPFYYLPDQDFGSRDSIFVPFFGVPTATITGVSRIARLAGAVVVPAVTRQLPGAHGYVVTFYPAWSDFPTDDEERDARRVNEFIEQRVLEMPEQYLWVHKRFKTRPPGAASVY
ncbi:MAG TPA: lipid A biosynthesis acyltransferase [Burkholderiales bacterium]|nr:lipid A biosynthesis acyltransferase [Burkholderiales bacterium]